MFVETLAADPELAALTPPTELGPDRTIRIHEGVGAATGKDAGAKDAVRPEADAEGATSVAEATAPGARLRRWAGAV
jgi:hypothetical protein